MSRILIAEDELIERTVLVRTLKKRFADCEILEAENGRQALGLFRANPVQVAILDIEMPGIRGDEAASIMRRECGEVSIIFLTAYDKFEYAKRAVSVRAMEYLLKPYSREEIIAAVEAALDWNGRLSHMQTPVSGEQFLSEETGENDEPWEGEVNRRDVMLGMVEEYVRKNYMHNISSYEAARSVNYSENYFCKTFKQQYGRSFMAYLTEFRLEEAKKLLRMPTVNVKEVGQRVGYPDPNYFARVFRKYTGCSPSEYRSSCLKQL